MHASSQQQLLLLDLAAADTKVAQLQRALKAKPEAEAAAELEAEAAPLRQNLLELRRAGEAIATDMRKLESDIATAKARVDRNESMIASSDPKIAQGLQHELETLAARIEALEMSELEMLEKQERLQAESVQTQQQLDTIDEKRAALAAQAASRNAELEKLLAEHTQLRADAAAAVPGELLAEYESIRAHSGIGAARLRAGVSEASNMKLSPGELAEINAASADELVYCPLTGAILVRAE